MTKFFKTLTLITLILSSSAHARRDDDGARLIYKNSEAGFAGEALEHSLTQFALTHHADLKDQVTSASVNILDALNAEVMIETSAGNFEYQCTRFTTTSRGGSVIKKEVVCRK